MGNDPFVDNALKISDNLGEIICALHLQISKYYAIIGHMWKLF